MSSGTQLVSRRALPRYQSEEIKILGKYFISSSEDQIHDLSRLHFYKLLFLRMAPEIRIIMINLIIHIFRLLRA